MEIDKPIAEMTERQIVTTSDRAVALREHAEVFNCTIVNGALMTNDNVSLLISGTAENIESLLMVINYE